MATTTNFTCNKDARIAQSGSTELGSGTSDGLPYGTYSGYKYRVLLGFSINMAGWTSITTAELYYKSSNQIHVAFGSDPTLVAQRITGSWSEGSSSGLSASNSVIYPGPSVTGTNQVQDDAPTGENTWGVVNVTAMMRDVLAGGAFYGIRLIGTDNSSVESGSSSNVGEIYSRESGSGTAYLKITYETNRAPNVPTVSSPSVSGGLSGSDTPTFDVNMTDPDGNAINQFNWQIDDNADFSSPIQDVYSGSPVGASGITVGVVPAALARGGTYYFRARAADVSVWGGWSTPFQVKIASLPTLTMSEPSASGRLARLTYTPGAGWGSPRAVINWGMTCPDGGTQASWRLEFYGDAAGAPSGLIEDITVNDTQSSRVVPYNLVEGNYYNVRVWATCSHGLTQAVGFTRVRARWGVAVYGTDMGAAAIGSLTLTTLDVSDETTGGQGRVALEYQTTTANTPPSVWAATIGGAGLNRYFWYAVYLLTWGASPAVSPTLNALTITYTTSTIVPDKWQLTDAANQSGDVSSFVYGTKSLRMKGRASPGHAANQVIDVVPDTNYIVSGRVQTSGDAKGRIDLLIGGNIVANTGQQLPNIEFEDPRSRMQTGVWNSGSNTQVTVRCISEGGLGTTCWFDALKMEASTVVTPWSPGYVANAVVLDAGGLQIDASQGGIFRLKGSAGGARDIVEVGPNGLRFGGDNVDLYSPASNHLKASGSFEAGGYLQSAGIMYPAAGVSAGGPIIGPYNLSSGGANGKLFIPGNAASGNNWAKIMSGNIPGQYWQHQVHGYITTRYGVSELSYVVHADAGPAAQPAVVGSIRPTADYANLSIHACVVVVRQVNPIIYDVWVQVPSGYAFLTWYPDIIDGEGSMPVIEGPSNYGWASNPPAGTQYALFLQSSPRYQMGSTTRNIAAANGTAQGIVTFPVAFQYTPFVWAYANASAGNAAYVTIQSVSTTQFDLGLKAVTPFNYSVVWMAISPTGYPY